jgi:hypothetical protein
VTSTAPIALKRFGCLMRCQEMLASQPNEKERGGEIYIERQIDCPVLIWNWERKEQKCSRWGVSRSTECRLEEQIMCGAQAASRIVCSQSGASRNARARAWVQAQGGRTEREGRRRAYVHTASESRTVCGSQARCVADACRPAVSGFEGGVGGGIALKRD